MTQKKRLGTLCNVLEQFEYEMVKSPREFLLAAVLLPGLSSGETLQPVPLGIPPWHALLRVQTELGERCTGFLIAPSVAVTAAHCLFLSRTGGYLQPGSVHVLLRYRMGRYDAHARVRRFIVPPLYDPGREARSAGLDRALLILDHPIAPMGDTLRPMRVLPPVGTELRLAGYGQDRDEVAAAGPVCRVTGLQADATGAGVIAHDCAGTRGTSGAPLLARQADGSWQVAGVQIEARAGAAGGLAASMMAPEQPR